MKAVREVTVQCLGVHGRRLLRADEGQRVRRVDRRGSRHHTLRFCGATHWHHGLPEPAYVRNSPTRAIDRLTTPMLISFGDQDGTVDFRQGVEMYNCARRAGQQFVMLAYANENHSAAEKPHQIDYHRRILQWFGHEL
jgi:dipeptidyl aminopeptidase/acylaminoacyl peptidase